MKEIEPMAGYNWMKVVDVMTKDPLTVTPGETIEPDNKGGQATFPF
jgi:hypothetical protein